MVSKNYHQLIKNVFNRCQDSVQSHKRLLGELFEIYEEVTRDFHVFFAFFSEMFCIATS